MLSDPGPSKDWTFTSVYALVLLTLVSTLNYFDRTVLSLMLTPIKKEFHASDTTMGAISTLIAAYAVFGIPIAWLAERWSRRNIVVIGLFFWSLMTGLTGFVGSVLQLGFARFFMAVGESCGLAPSQSILSDLFSKAARPFVLSVITTASSLSLIVFAPIAGLILTHWGWRAVFVAFGVPGMLLALLLLATVREPRRVNAAGEAVREPPAPFFDAFAFLCRSRAFLFCLAGTTVMGAYLYGVSAWGPTLLVRVRHYSVAEVSTWIQPIRGAIAMAGILLGGWLAGRLERMDERWRCWLPGLSLLALAPCEFVYVFAGPLPVWMIAMCLSSFFSIMHQGPIYAAYVGVAKPRTRAVAVAVPLLGATVMGQFLGPFLIGVLNDALRARFGDEGIRYSMLVVMACAFIAGLCYLAASRYVIEDTRRAAVS